MTKETENLEITETGILENREAEEDPCEDTMTSTLSLREEEEDTAKILLPTCTEDHPIQDTIKDHTTIWETTRETLTRGTVTTSSTIMMALICIMTDITTEAIEVAMDHP